MADRFEPAACLIESDWWWTTIVKGYVRPWLSEAHAQNRAVVRSFAAAAAVMASSGFSTVVEGIVGPWMLDIVLAEAGAAGVDVHYVVLRPSLDVALDRALSREGEERVPGHPALTDPEPVRKMWHEFSDLGSFEAHVVDNSSLSADETAQRVYSLVSDGAAVVSSR